jgi:hypothetical protein
VSKRRTSIGIMARLLSLSALLALISLYISGCCWPWETCDPECKVTPGTLDFDSVKIGQHKDLTFAIKNEGGGTLTGKVSEACDDYSIVSGGDSAWAKVSHA